MAITLAEAKVGMADKVDQQVIDTFRRSSLLLDRLTFDNAISPVPVDPRLPTVTFSLKLPARPRCVPSTANIRRERPSGRRNH